MRQSEKLSITIPSQLLEELTEEIAVKVAARLKAEMHQVTSATSAPAVFEEEKFKPTFLRLGEDTPQPTTQDLSLFVAGSGN